MFAILVFGRKFYQNVEDSVKCACLTSRANRRTALRFEKVAEAKGVRALRCLRPTVARRNSPAAELQAQISKFRVRNSLFAASALEGANNARFAASCGPGVHTPIGYKCIYTAEAVLRE